ncbi:hypothetical protein [Acidovorax cavernicola]|uniref:Uncharacterized protein n=1 Tax=Acidovorax cavernicola TaxID=1675792 RepID=A0A9X8GTL8_9BURK|nr:hypothetical protein [Acidovorax cavernicola]RIX76315.1 hypothetical protein D3H34_22480 [Acidovorax cavernicola]
MSLISRVEVSNYLTEGINMHRRSADWKPMLTGITLRMDGGKSALVNITNGGGKTSLVEILLYLLSRDARLLKKIREKVAPRNRGYTHARIEFRTPPEDTYSAPSLLEIDPLNLPGETHVVGVALNDDINDPPIFYSYSGTLEDSPCYLYDGKSITPVADGQFVAATKALRGCKWNRFANRMDWEDHIRLFLPIEVIRRNVVYQLKGSDDQNASFFDFKPRGGESYDSAFFRSVVAPDLVSNLLSSFAEEDESAVEDTLLKSLTQIVRADKEILIKETRLAVREKGIDDLQPILAAGRHAQQQQRQRDALLRELRSDIAFLRHFGLQDTRHTLPGLPRSLPRMGEQDPRILTALKGMVISRDEGILLLDKTLSDLSAVEVRILSEVADRKQIPSFSARTQVIDFACDFENLTSGSTKGGHYRKGYPKDSALRLPEFLVSRAGARTAGLKEVLLQAFTIAQAQIDTNPASRQVRALETARLRLLGEARQGEEAKSKLAGEVEQLKLQVKDRADNQGAWEDFVKIALQLPEAMRTDPEGARTWLGEQLDALQAQATSRNTRRGELNAVWADHVAVLEFHGLEGLQGARDRFEALQARHEHIQSEAKRIVPALGQASKTASTRQRAVQPLVDKSNAAQRKLDAFERLAAGVQRFATVFGAVDPAGVDPARDLVLADKAVARSQGGLKGLTDEQDILRRLKAQCATLETIFDANVDPLTYDPVKRHADTSDELSTVRQELVALLPQKEAIDLFEDRFPQVMPQAWIDDAEGRRADLEHELQQQVALQTNLAKEHEAIEQMRSVEDGSFAAAWSILGGASLKAQRLHQVLMAAGLPQQACNDAMSAMSGMLSAPVFDTIDELKIAAGLLEAGSASVPLILKDELFRALSEGVTSNEQIRMLGFIGGPTSRRVRILLDAQFARAELQRVAQELLACQGAIAQTRVALSEVVPDSEDYKLALSAKAALAAGAGQRYEARTKEAEQLAAQVTRLKTQIQPQSLEVLRAAKEFLQRGGRPRLDELGEQIPGKEAELAQTTEAQTIAKERASHENLKARDDAMEHHRLGGDRTRLQAQRDHEQACEAVKIAQAQVEEAQAALEDLTRQQQQLQEVQGEHDQDGGEQARVRYERVLEFAQNTTDLQFMQNFEAQSKEITRATDRLATALRVNFVRAAAFRAHHGKSDQGLLDEIGQKEQAAQELDVSIASARQEAQRIADADIPSWQRLARSIHELAYEVGSRVARTKEAAAHAQDLEEGAAVPEVHASYREAMAVLATLSNPSLQSHGAVVERVDALAQTIQAMNLQEDLQRHKEVSNSLLAAQHQYRNLNTSFCETARLAIESRDAPFNSLEIEEISRATPDSIEGLGTLFEQLQASLTKERDEAQQAKNIASQTAQDTLSQLAGLIESATDNLKTLNKVMAGYPHGRFFFETQVTGKAGVQNILDELKEDVEKALREQDGRSRGMRRGSDTQLKAMLRDKLIECVFTSTEVQFVNGGIWGGRKSHVSEKLSTGQKIALEFMWIVRQAEYEIERGLLEMTSKQAARSRAKANRVILIDGIFSTLSDRRIIKEALNGLRDLGGNFQIIGFLHSPTWNNDFTVFPVYHVGKKLVNREGDGLVSFRERGREPGTVGFLSAITQPLTSESVT